MFPVNPKKIQQMMKQIGMKQEDISAKRVIIEQEDKNIIIECPSVAKINISGNETFQISGDVREESKEDEEKLKEEDIKIIMEKTGKSEEEAREALGKVNGDLAEAIISLQ